MAAFSGRVIGTLPRPFSDNARGSAGPRIRARMHYALRCRAHPPLGSWLSARERSRYPEPWEHAVFEAGHGGNPFAGEGKDVKADPVADAGRGVQVGSERRMTVGSRAHEVEPPPRAEDASAEAGHDVSARVFEGHRWHRDEDVVRQKGHQRVEIGGLVRADELRHERILGG